MNNKLKVVFSVLLILFIGMSYAQNSSVSTSFDENASSYFSSDSNDSNSNGNLNTDSNTGGNPSSKNMSSGWMYARMVIVLIFVCILAYVFVWFLKKKMTNPKLENTDNEYLRRAAFINIGVNKSIEVITLIDKAYLIGVTDEKITLLSEIDDKELIQAMNLTADKKKNIKNPVNFSEVLELFTKKSGQKNAFSNTESNIDSMINSLNSSDGNEIKSTNQEE